MSTVDGCVLLACSGAKVRFRPLADWPDWANWAAPDQAMTEPMGLG
jgi:hypothetical protein